MVTNISKNVSEAVELFNINNCFFLFYIIIPIINFTFTSIFFLVWNWNVICDESVISLSSWLLVFIMIETIYLITVILSAHYHKFGNRIGIRNVGFIIILFLILICKIIGTIIFFHDLKGHQPISYKLWSIAISFLFFQWIFFSSIIISYYPSNGDRLE